MDRTEEKVKRNKETRKNTILKFLILLNLPKQRNENLFLANLTYLSFCLHRIHLSCIKVFITLYSMHRNEHFKILTYSTLRQLTTLCASYVKAFID